MDQNVENEIIIRDKVIASLKNEVKVQDELIKAQKVMIKTLEEKNAGLTKMMEGFLSPDRKVSVTNNEAKMKN